LKRYKYSDTGGTEVFEDADIILIARWVAKENIAGEIYFVPYAKVLPRHVACSTCTVVKVGEAPARE
jgi:hypothetical protein